MNLSKYDIPYMFLYQQYIFNCDSTASCLTRVWWPRRRRGWAGGGAPPPPPGGGRAPTCSWDAGAAPAETNAKNILRSSLSEFLLKFLKILKRNLEKSPKCKFYALTQNFFTFGAFAE